MIKGGVELTGLRNIRTTQNSMRRKPVSRVQMSVYLDLYMIGKEKDRLERELYLIEKRKGVIQKRMNDISDEMKRLEEKEAKRHQANFEEIKKVSAKDWKKMPLKY